MTADARTTARLVLRPPGPTDAPGYRALLMHPVTGEWLRPEPLEPFGLADAEEWLAADEGQWERFGFGPWAVIERDGGAYLGRVGLRRDKIGDRAGIELLWAIDPARHGEGIAAEAAAAAIEFAAELELEAVFAMILPVNLASRRVAEKIGMTVDGEVMHAGFEHLLFRAAPRAADPGLDSPR